MIVDPCSFYILGTAQLANLLRGIFSSVLHLQDIFLVFRIKKNNTNKN